jgi:hypothetical protein
MDRRRSDSIEFTYQTTWLEDLNDDDVIRIAKIIADIFIERLEGRSQIEKPSNGDNTDKKAA